jgi:hypothetical protein
MEGWELQLQAVCLQWWDGVVVWHQLLLLNHCIG